MGYDSPFNVIEVPVEKHAREIQKTKRGTRRGKTAKAVIMSSLS